MDTYKISGSFPLTFINFIIIITATTVGSDETRNYRTEYMQQKVDHFSFSNMDTFQQKYLISDEFWNPGVGPVFIYAGNEGNIEVFSNHTEMCKFLPDSSVDDAELLKGINLVASVYFNFTGYMNCYNISDTTTGGIDYAVWGFQRCTEMVMPLCTDGVEDMFEPEEWDSEGHSDDCYKKFKVRPNAKLAETFYFGRNISAASNIIFSNGDLDPWSSSGVVESVSKSLVAIFIEDSAHHLDLRSEDLKDPDSVKQARNLEKTIIQEWIGQFYGKTTQK